MQKKLNKKNQRGSVSLFILVSALFFLVVVLGVGITLRNKEAAMNTQFQRIKENYEEDVGREPAIYTEKIEEQNNL